MPRVQSRKIISQITNCEFPNYLASFFPRYLAHWSGAAPIIRSRKRAGTNRPRQNMWEIARHLSWKVTTKQTKLAYLLPVITPFMFGDQKSFGTMNFAKRAGAS